MGLTYLGAKTAKGEPEHLGPLYEIRKLRDGLKPPAWGRDHHAMCAGGYRVPVLFTPYASRREMLRDLPVIVPYLLRFAKTRVVIALQTFWLQLKAE